MKKEQISEAIGEISPRYVSEAMLAAGDARAPGARSRRALRPGLAAAVIAGLLVLTAGAVFQLIPVLQNYFGEGAQYVYRKNSQILNRSQTVNGWTMTVTDCIGDDQFLYIGMEVTAPAGTVLDHTGGGSSGLGVRDIQEWGFSPGYGIMAGSIAVEGGTARPMAYYINQIPDEDGNDNHLSFVMWVNCREPLDGKVISLTFENVYHVLPGPAGTKISDFDGAWHFDAIKLDLTDQTVRLKPNLTVPVLDTAATLTDLSVSPISIMVRFEGAGLIGQQQRYPNSYNIADPTITLYDKQGNVMQLERDRAPFGNRAQSGCDNDTGKLWIVESYETLIDLDALGSIEVCGISIPIQ